MNNDRKKINKILKVNVVTFLRDIGFKGSFPHFRRIGKTKIDLLMFQFSLYGKQFVVEIAQCPSDGILHPWGEKRPPQTVKVYDVSPTGRGAGRRTRIPISKDDAEAWLSYETEEELSKIAEKVLYLIKTEAVPWWNKK